jgi:aerobic carbon-monoxide dehydrogenase medium subunit
VYPAPFEYIEPTSLQEAVELLSKYGESARILAGGQSLIPLMKLRLARPQYLIGLNRVPALSYIKENNGWLLIGALTRHVEIEESSIVQKKIPLMQQAARVIGDQQVRNLGTVGGAIVEADPAGDWGPAVLALNACFKCVGPQGERELKAEDFFSFAYTTALHDNEVLTEIAVPLPSVPSLGTYMKLERVTGDFAIASVAIQMNLDKEGFCRDIGIGLGGVDDKPIKALSVEALLRDQRLSHDAIDTAANRIQEIANPISDLRGSAEYKREALKVIFRRALERLIAQSPHSIKLG